jgi:hypothetical protein
MAKNCDVCKKKMGIFEKKFSLNPFEILCNDCYRNEENKILENVRKRDAENLAKEQKEEQKRKEEEQKRKEEESFRILQEKLIYKREFLNGFSNLSNIYVSLNIRIDIMDDKIIKSNIGNQFDLFEFLTYEMYKDIGNSEASSKVSEIIFNEKFLRKISNSILKPTMTNNNNYTINTFDMLIKYISLFKNLESNICSNILNALISGDYNTKVIDDIILDAVDRSGDNGAASFNSIVFFAGSILYSSIFIRAIILSRSVNKFINNIELFKMYKNLRCDTNCTLDEISSKMFPIYNEYYSNIFQDKFDESTFNSLINIVDSYDVYIFPEESLHNTLYDNEIRENIQETGSLNLKKLLETIDNKLFFDAFKFEYTKPTNDVAYIALYKYIIKKTAEDIPIELFFQVITDKFDYINLLKSKEKKIELQIEKERLLRGDLFTEKAEEIDKLNFDNISNGYEFEHYLKNVFCKLGYESMVTKASNDQGADLIIEKQGIRTVVQAKYYTNPVGNKAIQEVVSAIAFYKANKGMVVTNSTYTKSAIELAEANNIELIDGGHLSNMRNEIIRKIG